MATVKALMGSVDRFDFQQVSSLIPRVELAELQPFFEIMLHYNKRRITRNQTKLSFITPDSWLDEHAIRKQYEGLHFERNCQEKDRISLLGVGHKLINRALEQAIELTSCVTQLSTVENPIVVYQILDRVTGNQANIQQVIVGLEINFDNLENIKLLKDWEILLLLNNSYRSINKSSKSALTINNFENIIDVLPEAENYLKQNLVSLDLPFRVPLIQLNAVIFPQVLGAEHL